MKFQVNGEPIPQGSKTGRVSGKRIYILRGRTVPRGTEGAVMAVLEPKVILTEISDMATKTRPSNRLKTWRQRIAAQAARRMDSPVWDGPVRLSCEFVIPRPPSHWTKVGKRLKKSAPDYPKRPDLSKLIRAVEDALQDTVYRDDGQVPRYGDMVKRYSTRIDGWGGVFIEVERIEDGEDTDQAHDQHQQTRLRLV